MSIIDHQISRRSFHGCCALGALTASERLLLAVDVSKLNFTPCKDVDIELAGNIQDGSIPLARAPMRRRDTDRYTITDRAILEDANADVAAEITRNLGPIAARSPRLVDGVKARAARQRFDAQPSLGKARAPARAAFATKWEDGRPLKVFFYRGGSTFAKNMIDIANEWGKWGKISFTSASSRNDSDIRVGLERQQGHWSYIGEQVDPSRSQTMNLEMQDVPTPGEYNYGVVLHEFGHALGMIHEHQSPKSGNFFDRDATIAYFRNDQQWTDEEIRINVLDRYDEARLIRLSEFDKDSVMLYKYPASILTDASAGGTKANVELSSKDKEYIGLVYGAQEGVVIDPSQPNQPAIAATRKIEIDGDLLDGMITPKAAINRFELELSGTEKPWVFTEGYTQVRIAIRKGKSKKDFASANPETPDFVNTFQRLVGLGKGKYIIEVEHLRKRGAGAYKIGVSTKPPMN